MLNTGIVNKQLNCSPTFVMVTLTRYTVQKTTKAWLTLAHAAGMYPFFERVAFYVKFNCLWNVFKLMSGAEDVLAS